MNIYEKIQAVRIALKNEDIKMTGKNDYAGYTYFELDDFLTPLNRLMNEYKMTAIPSFTNDIAMLTAINIEQPDEQITITSPFGSANLKGCHEVQNIGATETYQRRYLYQALFDISEKDALNKTQGMPQNSTKIQSSTNNSTQTKTSEKHAENASKQVCTECGNEVTEKVAKFSQENFGKVLCFDCQRKQDKANNDENDLPF